MANPILAGSRQETHASRIERGLRACLVKVRVKLFCGFWRTRRIYVIALFGRNASKTEEAALQKQLT